MNISEVLPLFNNVKKSGGGYTATCPMCGDSHHLYITPKDDKILFYCQKCGAGFNEIVKVVSIPKEKTNAAPTIVEQYDHIYKKPNGEISYCKTRTKFSNGKKKFAFHYTENGKKHFKKPSICDTLYNLDLLQNASADETLYIVEGEKCADIMTKHGFLCTTTNTGAGSGKIKFSGTDLRLLEKFTNKVVIPDNDTVGMKYADNFTGAKVLKLSEIWQEIKPKQDIFDFISLGGDLDSIKNYEFEYIKEFEELTREDLISTKLFDRLLALDCNFEQLQAVTKCQARARELGATNDFKMNFKQYKISLALKHNNSQGRLTQFHNQPLQLNCGDWIADDFGVKKNEISRSNGEVSVKFASVIPIMPIEILYNEDEQIEKINLAFYKNGWKNIICDRSTVANANKIIELANKGVEVHSDNAKLLVKYIAECVSKNLDILPRVKASSRLGWENGEFMPYCGDVRFDGDNENKHLFNAVKSEGNYALWVKGTKKLRDNIYLRLMMDTSFASVLVDKLHAAPFIFHLWGGTESGKTVALMVAMSIWGNPALGKLVKTMNMTINNMLSTCGFLHSLPFAGDELQTIKTKYTDYDSIIMKVAEGIDRGRMSYDKMNKTKTWANTILFTGEEPCTKSYSGGGAKNRVIEIEVNGKVIHEGNKVANFVRANYGQAGKEFVKIVQNTENLQERFDSLFSSITKNCDTTDKQAMAMSIILLADELVSEHIYDNKALNYTEVSCFMNSKKEVDVSARAYDFVINLIARHSLRFASLEHNNGEIWGKEELDCVYINKDVLISKMSEQGFEFDAVKKKWAEKGLLIKNSQGRFVHNTKCFNIKGIYVKLATTIDEDDSKNYVDNDINIDDFNNLPY